MYILYFLFLISLCMMCFLSFLSNSSWIVEFLIVNLQTLTFGFSFLMDKESSIFMSTVCLIFSMVFFYSFSYMSSEVYLKRFISILSLFAASMCILILSSSLFSSLIGWDGLGVTSLFLILFYYSKSSLKAGTLTFLMNRVGDCFFIMALTSMLLIGENQVFFTSSEYPSTLALLMITTSISKSAQIPFSTWLPAAMEAPTPVSSLVHSSTLVTAGIFLLYRYHLMWENSELKSMLMILSIGTCFMAALSAMVENDLKKLIALSTLSQLGFIMFSFSLGLLAQGYLHMIMHAFFKALLFMCAGMIIHSYKGSQSILTMSLSMNSSPLLSSIMSCSILSMMGQPFMAGFYSKDSIIDSLKLTEWSVLVYVILVSSFVCTAMYSIRMVWYLMKSSSNWHSLSESDYSMVKPMVSLAYLSCFGGSLISWLLMESSMFVDSSKESILLLILLSILIYWVMIIEVSSSEFLESKWSLVTFNSMLSSSFFIVIWKYQNSSDLVGLPELLNKNLKYMLFSLAKGLELTMVQYSGNLEVFSFLMGLILVVM